MSYRLYAINCEMEKVLENRGNEPLLPHIAVPRFSFSLFVVCLVLKYTQGCMDGHTPIFVVAA